MTLERVEEIREELSTHKQNKAIAESKIKEIEKEWKEEYGLKSVKEVEAFIKKTETEIEDLEKKEAELEEQIEDLLEEIEEG